MAKQENATSTRLAPEHQAALEEHGLFERLKKLPLEKIVAIIIGLLSKGMAPEGVQAAPAATTLQADYGINLAGLPWLKVLALVKALIAFIESQYPGEVPAE
jgi:hypothetical protein